MADLGAIVSAFIWTEFARDLGLCALVVVAYGQVRRRLPSGPAVAPILCDVLTGLIFGAAAVALMINPIEVTPGIFIDGRHVPLVLAGLFGGPPAAAVAFVLAMTYEIPLGGIGVLPGVAASAASAAVGGIVAETLRRRRVPLQVQHLPLLGLLAGSAELLGVLLLPTPGLALDVIRAVGVPLLATVVLGTSFLGWLLIEERRHYETEQRLAALTANLPGVVYQRHLAADGKMTYTYVSKRLREFWGLDPADVIADPARLLERLHPDDRARVEASIAEATRRRGVLADEYRVIDPAGNVRWLRALASPRTPHGGTGEVVWDALVMEITELKQAEEDLRLLNATLERRVDERSAALREREAELFEARKLEALGEAVGTVAHDFNNLLTAIIGNLELARPRPDGDERRRTFLAEALAAAERGERMIENLLAFIRRRPLELVAVDVNATVRELGVTLRGLTGSAIEIRLDLAPDLEPALTNREELERALLNLVTNARDALTEDGGGTVTIETRNDSGGEAHAADNGARAPRRFVRLTVRDTGRGMPPEVRVRVFEPFYTTKRRGAGTGLGLSMVYGFVRRSGGRVTIDSAEGQGTAVTICLPQAGGGA
jgi:PAS domain S-box-containing protein